MEGKLNVFHFPFQPFPRVSVGMELEIQLFFKRILNGKSWKVTMEPTTNEDKGERGEDRRFLPGNAGGLGNPYARKVAALRGSLNNAVTHEDIEEIIHSQVEKAKQGDIVS